MENLQEKFNKKVEDIIPEETPFSEPRANRMMSPEEWILKYGVNLSVEEIRKELETDLSDIEIQALLEKARGVV